MRVWKKIVAIKASMNQGLSQKLKLAFPDVVPVVRPLVENPRIPDPNWLAGFTSAEGCFRINIFKATTNIVPSPPPDTPPLTYLFPFPNTSFPLSSVEERGKDRQRKGEKRYPGMGGGGGDQREWPIPEGTPRRDKRCN